MTVAGAPTSRVMVLLPATRRLAALVVLCERLRQTPSPRTGVVEADGPADRPKADDAAAAPGAGVVDSSNMRRVFTGGAPLW